MPTVREIAKKMEQLAPLSLAEDFDNVGLLVGENEREVRRVLVALDADSDAVIEAIALGADMLITHHPILFKPVQRIVGDTPEGAKLLALVKHGISLYAAHTNLDFAEGGVNDLLAERLGLFDVRLLRDDAEQVCTRMGSIDKTILGAFASDVGRRLGSAVVKVVGDKGWTVKQVAVSSGSGAFMLSAAQRSGCDVLVTGEAKYHEEQLAVELGIALVEAGHFETENIVCKRVQEYLTSAFADIEVFVSKRTRTYYYGV